VKLTVAVTRIGGVAPLKSALLVGDVIEIVAASSQAGAPNARKKNNMRHNDPR
jgi:hypothetical protein